MFNKLTTLVALLLVAASVQAQDVDLFKMLDDESKESDKNRIDYASAAFKTTRLINGHTIENTGKGIMDLKISHRFGTLNQGPRDLWGFDNARMRFGFDYGVTDRFMIGIGRSTFQKQYDGFFKYKLVRQSSGKRNMPFSVGLLASAMIKTEKEAVDPFNKKNFSDKLHYAFQAIIARKFSDNTSLQISPTVVHHNRVPSGYSNDIYAIGFGGRQKVSKRISINGEYYYVLPDYKLANTYNSLSFGIDIETGGHVFQLHFTNSTPMTESSFITETTQSWGQGGIHFGFNISRVFVIGGKKKRTREAELKKVESN
jgi:hypothetical protein